MLRIAGSYTTTLSPGSRVGFQAPNPPSVPYGTQLTAPWFNDVQENVCCLIESVNITLQDGDSIGGAGQLTQAIKRVTLSNYTLATATGLLTADNAGRVIVDATAGNVVLTLPAAAGANGTLAGTGTVNSTGLHFFRRDSTGNTVTIQPGGSDALDCNGVSGSFLVGPLMSADVFSDGVATWQMIQFPAAPAPLAWQEWTAHGTNTFVVPPGKFNVRATLQGAGGGGGGIKQSGDASAAGGGSDFDVFSIPVQPGWSLTVVVGQGGAAGTSGSTPTAGGAGGLTSIFHGATLLAEVAGGSGGAVSAGGGVITSGTASGTGTAGAGVSMISSQPAAQSSEAITISGGYFWNAAGGAPYGRAVQVTYLLLPTAPAEPGRGGWGAIYLSGVGSPSAGADGYARLEY